MLFQVFALSAIKAVRTFSRKRVHIFAFAPVPAGSMHRAMQVHGNDLEHEESLRQRLEREASAKGQSLADFAKEVFNCDPGYLGAKLIRLSS